MSRLYTKFTADRCSCDALMVLKTCTRVVSLDCFKLRSSWDFVFLRTKNYS